MKNRKQVDWGEGGGAILARVHRVTLNQRPE